MKIAWDENFFLRQSLFHFEACKFIHLPAFNAKPKSVFISFSFNA